MSTISPSKHLWLELRPDYIDANFDQVRAYLQSFRNNSDSQDTFYQTTLDLLRRRAKELVSAESAKAIGESETIDTEKDVFALKLLCLYLLNEHKPQEDTFKEAYFTLVFILARCARNKDPKMVESLVSLDLEILSCESVKATGISWEIFDLFSTDILTHNVINGHLLVDDPKRYVIFEKQGTLRANVGKVMLAPVNSDNMKAGEAGMVPSMTFLNDALQVVDARSNRLKQSDYSDLSRIEAFTDDFIQRQSAVKPHVKKLSQYAAGDVMDVELVSKGDTLRVVTVDPAYEVIEGDFMISQADKLLYYQMSDFKAHLNVGDQFSVKLQSYSDKGNSKFSIDSEFKDYVIDEVYKPYRYKVVLATLMEILTNRLGKKQMLWWTEYGFPAYSDVVEDIPAGQMCYIELSDTGTDKYKHFVNAYFDSVADRGDTFEVEQSKADTIRGFVYEEPMPVSEDGNDVKLEGTLPRQLCRLLYYYQRTVRSASDRYRLLSTCRILAELVGDKDAERYIEFVSEYLEDVVAFADDDYAGIQPIQVPDSVDAADRGTSVRAEIVKILMEYGKDEDSEVLDSIIEDSDDELLERLAKLVQSANRIKNVVSDNLLVHIKKEIISNLSIDTEDKTDLEESKGVFYGNEDVTKEFKTSFFEAPDNSRHPQNWTVFKEICAFLNSDLGGTIYLGVQDNGYSSGLDRDMINLRKFGNKAYADNMDGYKRYILDDAKKYFPDQAVLLNLTFTPLEDDKVLAIRVEPWDSGIVEMDGQAFIRLDSESPVMSVQMRDAVIRRKLLSKKDDAGIIRSLMKAREEKLCVNLHGYSSSSKTATRYTMEPFAFDDDYQTVWCYDPESGKCKTYKVVRIGSVEILDTKWKNAARHHQGKTDIFRMTGDREFLVEMQLDQYAKLLLCEEFPKAIDCLTESADKKSWYLQTKVCAVEGIGRFYLGLGKQHITIINSPELEQYVADFLKEQL